MLFGATRTIRFQSQAMFPDLSLRSTEVRCVTCQSCLQKGQEGESRELQAHQPHLDPWKGDGTANPGNHFQTLERHGDDQA